MGDLLGQTSRTAVYVIRTYGGVGGPPCEGRSYPDRVTNEMKMTRPTWAMIATIAALLVVIAWQRFTLVDPIQARSPGSIIRLTRDLRVYDCIDGSNVFTIPAGCRLQEMTPRGLATPIDRGGPEYTVVLRTTGGPRGSSLRGTASEWMDDYRVDLKELK
jgi:hypothetical protein